ncbi:MAG: hypothetical protein JWP30_1278 [Homoserinimonas sp.]|jgi:ABC-type sugar transport system permease subunit|nr:hypothetical protein [Homoserinimonas sp.]
MTEQTSTAPVQDSGLKADFVGAAIFIVIFAIALAMTFEWSDKAAMFPRIITGSGLAFSILLGLSLIVKWRRAQKPGYVERAHQSVEERFHDNVQEHSADAAEDLEPEDVEYVFATAGRKAWLHAMGWAALFLLLTVLLGLFAASGIFALTYLHWGGGRTWRFSIIYAVVLPVLLIALFRWLLYVPTPVGLLTGV